MQLGDLAAVRLSQVGAEHVGEQMVIPVPLPPVVERDKEQIRPLECNESCLPVAASGYRVAQRAGESVEDRSLQQEPAYLGGLAPSTSSTK